MDVKHVLFQKYQELIFLLSLAEVQTESRKRKRRLTDDEQDEDEDSGDSSVRCPVKQHECRLYELYRSKW